ncbi:MAG: TRAP transporter substrate-binding protein DctP [Chloroflexi bacterium]|nr:TRAP transporter substrate-binding protein DctP [Chloroflexota bacterium]
MKKGRLLILLILAGLLLAIGACTRTATPPAAKPAPAPSPTTAPKPAAPAITLKVQTFFNDVHPVTKGYTFFINELEKRAAGKVKIDYVLGDPYGKHANVFDLVSGGVVDFAHILPGYTPGRLPLMEFSGTFPFDWKNAEEVSYVHYKLAAKGYFDKELGAANFQYLFGMQGAPYDLFSRSLVKVPADLKGMKIRGAGGVMSRWVEAEGAIAVSMASAEQVVALQKGVIDGTMIQAASVAAMKLYEVTKFQNVIHLSTWYGPMATTTATWNKLPADVQKIVKDIAQAASENIGRVYDEQGAVAMKEFPKLGVQIYNPTADDMAKWLAPIKALLDSEVAKLKAAGYPMDNFMKDFEQFRSEWRASHK